SQLARLDRAKTIGLVHLTRGVDSKKINRLCEADSLRGAQGWITATGDLPRHERLDGDPGIDGRDDRPVGTGHHESTCVDRILYRYPTLHALLTHRLADVSNDRGLEPDVGRELEHRTYRASALDVTHIHEAVVGYIV